MASWSQIDAGDDSPNNLEIYQGAYMMPKTSGRGDRAASSWAPTPTKENSLRYAGQANSYNCGGLC